MADQELETFLSTFQAELRADNAAVFVGAGLSRGAGYVDWAGLLKPFADELKLNIKEEHDLVGLAQFFLNSQRGQKGRLSQALVDQFSDLKKPTENHEILARLPIRTYWTTNYDHLIEDALKAAGKIVDVKYTIPQLARTRSRRDVTLFKMHGDVEHSEKAVLTRDDYERYHLADIGAPFITALSGDLVEKTFVFLGFSFVDPNLNYILARVRNSFENHERQHYAVTARRQQLPDEPNDVFERAVIRQQLIIEDLYRFNIRTILVDNYPDVTNVLRGAETRFRRQTVFVSGSAHEYGSWNSSDAYAWVSKLAHELVNRDLRVATGFGLGVGPALVTGAVQAIYSRTDRTVNANLVMRPFPIGIQDAAERQTTFARYRAEMLQQSGIAIFLFGNKFDGSNVIPASGVKDEFNEAIKQGLIPIPVASTGFMAAEIWHEVRSSPDKYYKDPAKAVALLDQMGPKEPPDRAFSALLQMITFATRQEI